MQDEAFFTNQLWYNLGMAIPPFLQTYLPSYDIKDLDGKDVSVANEIITKILNLGDEKAVSWVFDNYTIDEIRGVVSSPKKGVWNEESLNYWKNILKIDQIREKNKAILNINPV